MSGLFGGTKIETSAPVISSLKLQTSCYGRAKPWIFGLVRVTPNIIDYVDFTSIPHTTTQKTGKGGGGSQSNTTYTYTVATIMAIGSGPIAGVRRMWQDKDVTSPGSLRLDLYLGDLEQMPWPYMASRHPERALSYRGLAYAASGAFDLGDSAGFGNHSMEVQAPNSIASKYPGSNVPDAEVADVISAILTDVNQGIGLDRDRVDGLEQFRSFCLASGIWVSPAYTEQKPAYEYLRNLLDIGFADCVYSGGIFKIVPYSDAKVINDITTYVPAIAPVYALTEDDFLGDAESDVLEVSRRSPDECYNSVSLKFADRALDYNDNVVTSDDPADIEQYGLRQQDAVEMREIADGRVAQKVADFLKHRKLYIRNEYKFRLPWKYVLLEPMDVVTLTYLEKALYNVPVLIYDIEEDTETGELVILAEDYPLGTHALAIKVPPTVEGNIPNFAIEPGNATIPALFEAPLQLTQNAPQVWLATAGGADWGGCDVWVSTDNAAYQRVGRVQGPARYGSISAPLGLGAAIDTLNVLSVDMSAARGAILGGTEENARDLITLSYVDGEYIAYANAALTGISRYDLSYLVRGAYGTDIAEHAVGKYFVRLDDAIFKYDYPKDWLGKTIWIKLVSFNRFGGGLQDMSQVMAHRYVIEGAPLAAVQNLRSASDWIGRDARITWDLLDGADRYDVQILAGTPVAIVRTSLAIAGNEFLYANDAMQADGGPWRQVVFRVRGRAVTGRTGPWSQLMATNEQVGALSGIRLEVGYQSVVFKCATPPDSDFAGLLVWLSRSADFVPTLANVDFDGLGTLAFLGSAQGEPLVQGATYYVWAAGYDDFGRDSLTISQSIAVVIPRNVATEVADGVIKESHLTPGLGGKIEHAIDLAEKFPEAAIEGLLASQRNAAGDKEALAMTQFIAMAQGDRANRTVARQVTTVETKVGGNTAAVQQIMESIDGINANIFLKASVNGKVAGMGIGVNGNVSEVAFLADKFFIAASDDVQASALFTIITQETVIGGVKVEPGMYVKAAYINAATIAEVIAGHAIIDSANIKEAAIGTLHVKDGFLTSAKIAETIESENYSTNIAGWKIWKNGVAEFNGVTIRGNLKAGTINIANRFIVDAEGRMQLIDIDGGGIRIANKLIEVLDENGTPRVQMGKVPQ